MTAHDQHSVSEDADRGRQKREGGNDSAPDRVDLRARCAVAEHEGSDTIFTDMVDPVKIRTCPDPVMRASYRRIGSVG